MDSSSSAIPMKRRKIEPAAAGFFLDLKKLLDVKSEWHKAPQVFRREDITRLGRDGLHDDRPEDILEEISSLIPEGLGMDVGDGVKLREFDFNGDQISKIHEHINKTYMPWESECKMRRGDFDTKNVFRNFINGRTAEGEKVGGSLTEKKFQYLDHLHWEHIFFAIEAKEDEKLKRNFLRLVDRFRKSCLRLNTDSPDFSETQDLSSLPVFWAGTKFAGMPLHFDTAGVNLVYQLKGRKRWFLAEKDSFYTTRLPFDETTVYGLRKKRHECGTKKVAKFREGNSMEDLMSDAKATGGVHVIDLAPGDLLLVPHHFWHATLTLSDTAISANQWLSVPADAEEQVREQVARCLVNSLCGRFTGVVHDGAVGGEEAMERLLPSNWSLDQVGVLDTDERKHDLDGLELGMCILEKDKCEKIEEALSRKLAPAAIMRAFVDACTQPDVLGKILGHLRPMLDGVAGTDITDD